MTVCLSERDTPTRGAVRRIKAMNGMKISSHPSLFFFDRLAVTIPDLSARCLSSARAGDRTSAHMRKTSTVKLLLELGADIEAKNKVRDQYGNREAARGDNQARW